MEKFNDYIEVQLFAMKADGPFCCNLLALPFYGALYKETRHMEAAKDGTWQRWVLE